MSIFQACPKGTLPWSSLLSIRNPSERQLGTLLGSQGRVLSAQVGPPWACPGVVDPGMLKRRPPGFPGLALDVERWVLKRGNFGHAQVLNS